jgi:hypothetical protein
MLNAVHCIRGSGNSGLHVRAPFVELVCDDGCKKFMCWLFLPWGRVAVDVRVSALRVAFIFGHLRALLGQHSRPLSQTRPLRLSSRSPRARLIPTPQQGLWRDSSLYPQVHDLVCPRYSVCFLRRNIQHFIWVGALSVCTPDLDRISCLPPRQPPHHRIPAASPR